MKVALIIGLLLVGAQFGHVIYSDIEFERAKAEWNAAHAKGDANAEGEAYHKEVIAHCKTGDFLWFLHGDHFCNDTPHP